MSEKNIIKKTIVIDEEKCVGCGLCAQVCQQSAIEIIDGKAKVTREDYCDGIGNCLPVCPVDAISFGETGEKLGEKLGENMSQNPKAQKPQIQNPKVQNLAVQKPENLPCGCPGMNAKELKPKVAAGKSAVGNVESQLRQWPVQIKLVSETATYFDGCNLLIAADCTAYAYGNFHGDFMKNKVTLIGCPKLDMGDYTEKLRNILSYNNVKSLTVVRMEVPCCGGIEMASVTALKESGKFIPWQVVTISTDGRILDI